VKIEDLVCTMDYHTMSRTVDMATPLNQSSINMLLVMLP